MPGMNRRGFGALELISVLAILAILTALVLPRVLRTTPPAQIPQTVNEAHITQALAELQALEPAIAAHVAQSGSLASRNGTPLAFSDSYDNFGQVLLSEGVIERPFWFNLGTNTTLRLVKLASVSSGTQFDALNGLYDLDGDGHNDMVGAAFVLEATIAGVHEVEASALNDRLDGPRLGARPGENDLVGRVVYLVAGPDGVTTVHIYITRR